MRNEPDDPSDYGPVPANEHLWTRVLAGQVRRVYALGDAVPSSRFLPHTLGLEPIGPRTYRYDWNGAPVPPGAHLSLTAELAADERWLARGWERADAEVFMHRSEAIVWLDDARARQRRLDARRRPKIEPLPWMLARLVKRVVRSWRSRRRDDEDGVAGHLLKVALAGAPDGFDPLAAMALGEFPDRVLRITRHEQLAALNAVRPTR